MKRMIHNGSIDRLLHVAANLAEEGFARAGPCCMKWESIQRRANEVKFSD